MARGRKSSYHDPNVTDAGERANPLIDTRPPHRLMLNKSIMFQPPADVIPPWRYAKSGIATPFQDDLWATEDRGSPGPLPPSYSQLARYAVLP